MDNRSKKTETRNTGVLPGKVSEMDGLLDPPEGTSPANTLTLAKLN